jgi:hypothetical protein
MMRTVLLALAGFVWACGGDMKPAAHPEARADAHAEAPRKTISQTGGPRMLSDAHIKLALAGEKEIALFRVLGIQEKAQGTRSYGTEYRITVLQSVPGNTTGKSAGKSDGRTCEHWGAPVLEKGGIYVAALDPHEQSWATDKGAFLQTTDAEADAVFQAHRQKAEGFLKAQDLLPDSVLQAALAGESSIVLANLNLGAGSTEGAAPGANWNCLMYVKETLAGPAKGNSTVPIQGPVGILPGTDYILSVRPKEEGPQRLVAVEVFPANREKRVKLHRDRLSALRKK